MFRTEEGDQEIVKSPELDITRFGMLGMIVFLPFRFVAVVFGTCLWNPSLSNVSW